MPRCLLPVTGSLITSMKQPAIGGMVAARTSASSLPAQSPNGARFAKKTIHTVHIPSVIP